MRKVLMMIALLFSVFSVALAQNKTVTGKVVDKGGEPLIGVSVTIKGTTKGVGTDVNGSFKLAVPSAGNTVLVFKYLGFKSKEVSLGGNTKLNVVMEDDATSLNEVVVIGYGTQKRKDITGSVTSVSGATIQQNPVSNVAEAIAGRMPGVQVNSTDGAPGAEIVIRVRGGGSVTQDNSPLYIVDGFPVNSINDIATTDIESIDILKDASSTAIYGARGANGVVIITTKSAKAGKTTITYNGFGQAKVMPKKLDVLSPYEFALGQYEYAALRGGTDLTNFTKYFGVYDDLEIYKSQRGTDWQDELFGDAKWAQQHNLSITGGTDKTKLSFSFTQNNEDGLMINSGYKRTYFNFKLNHEISKSLKLDLGTRFSNAVTDGAGTSGTSSIRISDAITTRPVNGLADNIIIDPAASETGDTDYDQFLRSMINPRQLADQDYRKRTEKTLNLTAGLSWNLLKGVTYRSELGVDLSNSDTRRYYGSLTGESRNVGGNLPLGELTKGEGDRYRWANTVNYQFKRNKVHDFNFLLGQEMVAGRASTDFTRAKYFSATIDPERMFANMTLGTPDRISTSDSPTESLFSFFGRGNYQLMNKYMFTLTLRADGSSKFAPGKQWGFFPAAAAAWRISDEEFLKGNTTLSDLKLRLSYGQAGNNRINNNLYKMSWAISSNRTIGFGETAQPYWVTASSVLANPDLKWETTVTRNAGLDFGLFRNRVTGSIDFYKNTTKDLLVESDIPAYSGYSKEMKNIGQTSNKGVELGLTASILNKKDFNLSATFNIGINRSKIDKLDGVNEKYFRSNWAGTDLKGIDDYKLIVGKTVGLMYGFVADGFYTVDDFDSYDATLKTYKLKAGVPNNSGVLGSAISLRPGMLKYKDLDGDGVVTEAKDRTIIGSALPKHTGGFGINANYKSFDFSTLLNWVYGNNVYNTGKIAFNSLYRTTYGNMMNAVAYDQRFKYIDANGQVVTDLEALRTLNENATMYSPYSMGNASVSFNSNAVEDGSFLRVSNITLGYSLPKSAVSKIKLSKLRVYGTVYNAFLWTNYSGYDPEVNSTRSSSYAALTPGVDYSAYPKSRTYTVGINATF